MATLAFIAVGLLSLLVFVLFGALLELYRDVRQLRDAAGILDRPLHVDIDPILDTAPGEYGLPSTLDNSGSALLLFLSERCLTCRVIASSLDKFLPPGLWVVVDARTSETADQFLKVTGLAAGERVIMDVGGRIAGRLGLNTSPVGFRIENGRFSGATTVPSTRYLLSILPASVYLNPAHGAKDDGQTQTDASVDQRAGERAWEPV